MTKVEALPRQTTLAPPTASFTLLVVGSALAVELLAPIMITHRLLPASVRYLSDLILVAMLVLTLARLFVQDNLPVIVLLILGVTAIGATVAGFEGQDVAATVWGWWTFFKYPLVGLFVYLHPRWPVSMSTWILRGNLALVALQLLVQIGQYATGQMPGDDLAGTLGRNGVGPLVYLIFLVLSFAFGHWLVRDAWKILTGVLFLGAVSSTLGEMKIFPVATAGMAAVGLLFYVLQGGRPYKLLLYAVAFALIIAFFGVYYNTAVSDVRGVRRIETYFEADTTEEYLNNVGYDVTTGAYYLGRGFALSYGWQLLQRDYTTFLFGYGLGARSESVSLGIVGEGLRQGYYGLFAGTSLLVLMQEQGVIGLGLLAGFLLWVGNALFKYSQRTLDLDTQILCYGIILYSAFWPVWVWYHKAWTFGVSMILYWGILGYLLCGSVRNGDYHEDSYV